MADDGAFSGPVWDVVGRPSRHGITWVWLLVDLDLSTAAQARAELEVCLLATGGAGWVLVYLGADRFVDLRGVRVLHDVAADVRNHGGELVVVAPPRCVRVLLSLSGPAVDLPVVESPGRAARMARSCRSRGMVRSRPVLPAGRR